MIERFSKRSREIRGRMAEVAERINRERARLGLEPVTAVSAEALDLAARQTRAAKLQHLATSELRAGWRKEAEAAGPDPDRLVRALRRVRGAPPLRPDPGLHRRVAAWLTEHASTFGERDVAQALADDDRAGFVSIPHSRCGMLDAAVRGLDRGPTVLTPTLSPTGELLRAARGYAARGWPVLPLCWPLPAGACACGRPGCSSPGKHPLVQRGLHAASTDPERIRRWWGRWLWANVGIRTGAASGLLVLDVDGTAGSGPPGRAAAPEAGTPTRACPRTDGCPARPVVRAPGSTSAPRAAPSSPRPRATPVAVAIAGCARAWSRRRPRPGRWSWRPRPSRRRRRPRPWPGPGPAATSWPRSEARQRRWPGPRSGPATSA